MSYIVFQRNHTFEARDGLEGPFTYPSGKVLYYDPTTDFYLSHSEAEIHLNEIFNILRAA